MLDPSSLASAWFLLPVGMCAGLVAGLFGVGGGLIIVPTLFYFLQGLGLSASDAMPMAVCTSLCSIVPTSASSAWTHWRLGHVDGRLLRLWSVPMLIGVVIGALMVSAIRSAFFAAVFGGMLLLVAFHKAKTYKGRGNDVSEKNVDKIRQPDWLHYPAAATVGLLSSLAGVGGGATGVPVLTYLGSGLRKAIGTCAVFGLLIALPGAILMLTFSQDLANAPLNSIRLLYWPALIFLLPATVTFAPLGAWLNSKLSENFLHYAFLSMLVVIGGRMFWHGISG